MEQRADREWMKTGPNVPVPELVRSNEYASGIIEALVTGVPLRFNGNVINTGLITNLPEGCCVEVPCVADREGVHPCHVGALPPPCAALNRSNVAVHELAVRAVLDRDRDAAFHAVALDPLTASCLSLAKIREMFEELWEAEGGLLGYFDK
jgi:alpha-galactosidase